MAGTNAGLVTAVAMVTSHSPDSSSSSPSPHADSTIASADTGATTMP
jgi:hypothetical protein